MAIWRIFATLVSDCAIRDLVLTETTPHDLRHTFAHRYLDQNFVQPSSWPSIFLRLIISSKEGFGKTAGRSTDVFYARFMRGEMGDELPFIKWAGRYELYLEARQEIDNQLAKVPMTV